MKSKKQKNKKSIYNKIKDVLFMSVDYWFFIFINKIKIFNNKFVTLLFLFGIIFLGIFYINLWQKYYYFTIQLNDYFLNKKTIVDYYDLWKKQKSEIIQNNFFDRDLPRYNIFIKDKYLKELNSNLPKSGYEYKPAKLIFEGQKYDVFIKYFGATFPNWINKDNPSLKIKLKDKKIKGCSNIELKSFRFHSKIKDEISQKMNLVTAERIPIKICINNICDKSFFRENKFRIQL